MACIAALAAGNEPFDDVEFSGEVAAAAAAAAAATMGFFMIVTGPLEEFDVAGPAAKRRWTLCFKDYGAEKKILAKFYRLQ